MPKLTREQLIQYVTSLLFEAREGGSRQHPAGTAADIVDTVLQNA